MPLFPERSPWLQSSWFDGAFILSPPILSSLAVLAFRDSFPRMGMPVWIWAVVILLLDGGHVYSTFFRTYLGPADFGGKKFLLLWVTPLLAWSTGVLLYAIGEKVYWRVFVYFLVFHFVRQQYGFMMLYSRKESPQRSRYLWIDKALIYLTAIYPLIWWHTRLPRSFYFYHSFDFIEGLPGIAETGCLALYLSFAVAYALKEVLLFAKYRSFSLPKQAVVLGSALWWYVAVVGQSSPAAFLLTIFIGHACPYVALIWLHENRRKERQRIFYPLYLPVFISTLVVAAIVEKGLIDALVFRAHSAIFPFFKWLPKITAPNVLVFLVPLLALPPLVHFIQDGFIWRFKSTKLFYP